MRAHLSLLFCAGVLAAFGGSQSVSAHDIRKFSSESTEEVPDIEDLMSRLDRFSLEPDEKAALFSVVRRTRIWTKEKLTVCFGPEEAFKSRKYLIAKIIPIANEWTKGTNLSFDFNSPDYLLCKRSSTADIRVDITSLEDGVFTSIVGKKAKASSLAGTIFSMKLQFPEPDKYYWLEEVFRFYVLHEFGHSIGFEHEHQRVDCDFDYKFIALEFGFADEVQAKANMEQKLNVPRHAYVGVNAISDKDYISTAFDDNSVMKYNLSTSDSPSGDNPGVYLKGTASKCYRSGWISHLTAYDEAGVKHAYQAPDLVSGSMELLVASDNNIKLSPSAAKVIELDAQKVTGEAAAKKPPSSISDLRREIEIVRASPKAFKALDAILTESQ